MNKNVIIYMVELLTPAQTCKLYSVTSETLRRWSKNNLISYTKTEGGHRRYKIEQHKQNEQIVYARVSSQKQKDDLKRQIEFLSRKYPSYRVIKDIGSGINFKRKGFRQILEQVFARNVREVVVASTDRFSRIGATELFEWIFEQFGAKLTILDRKRNTEDFANDLLEIITVFTARHYGKRKYSNKKDSILSNRNAENLSK